MNHQPSLSSSLRFRSPLLRWMAQSGLLLCAMKLKLDDKNNVVTTGEGDARHPVYVYDDGKELPFDAAGAVARISTLNGEAKTHREAKEAAETVLSAMNAAGVDPTKVDDIKKALATVANIDDKKLVDAGKVEEVRAAAVAAIQSQMDAMKTQFESTIRDKDTKLTERTRQLHDELIGGNFARSKLLTDPKHPVQLAIPADLAQAYFGRHFSVDEAGKIVAKDANGGQLYSRARPGDPNVTFDEALELLIDAYPHKASILKGSGAAGGGASGASGGGTGGRKTITRAALDALAPELRSGALKDAQLID